METERAKETVTSSERERQEEVTVTVRQGRRLTFREALELTERQVNAPGIRAFLQRDSRYAALAWDCLRAVAEVYTMPPNVVLKIDGEDRPAYVVADIFSELNEESMLAAITKIGARYDSVHHKRLYLRSALYNIVFEQADFS